MSRVASPRHKALFSAADCDIDEFRELVEQPVDLADYPNATEISLGAVVYDAHQLRAACAAAGDSIALRDELAAVLSSGPGIAVFRGAFEHDVIDRVTKIFFATIADERAANGVRGDHYGKPGANDRVWNALEKLAVADPDAFVEYYANDIVALASSAWLGPAYQITSQVNVVNPGGEAQMPHRDYHLGFMTQDMAAQFPRHVHLLSPALTLQGAIAHCDMPVESGPTLYLPQSHKYVPGYFAWRLPEFVAYFDEHHVQVPLAAGDAVFFNPAMFHAAGSNRTAGVRRIANLLQVNSALGRSLEAVDRERIVLAVYPALQRARAAGMDDAGVTNALAAAAEGYAFPTNLDRDQPVGRLTPTTQAEVVTDALAAGLSPAELAEQIAEHGARRRTY